MAHNTSHRKPIEAILFDLDGTLLDIDFGSFMNEYVSTMAGHFADEIPPDDFRRQLFQSTRAMIFNDRPGRTILDAFLEDFGAALPLPDDAIARFERYYETDFRRLERWGQPHAGGRELVEAALARDLIVVVATAPFFPKVAVRERLRWAGVSDLPFHFMTTSEIMTRSKPFPEYYMEIAERIDVAPEQCLMIGDEPLMDGVAARAGMHVALVGPDKPSFSEPWLSDSRLADYTPEDLARFPDLPALHRHLADQGIL